MKAERARLAAGLFAAVGMVAAGLAAFLYRSDSSEPDDDELPPHVQSRDDAIADELILTHFGRGGGFLYGYDLDTIVHRIINDRPEYVAPHPRISLGLPRTAGEYDKSTIRRFVRHHFDRITRCYDNRLRDAAGIDGEILVEFLITRTGAVDSATGAGFDGELARCVANVVGGIAFPKPADAVLVMLPITFHPTATLVVRDQLAADAAWYMAGEPFHRPARRSSLDQ